MQFRLRSAEPKDAVTLAEVHVKSWQQSYAGLMPSRFLNSLSVSDRAERWRKNLEEVNVEGPKTTLVIESSDPSIIGFASGGFIRQSVVGFDGELYAIYLLASYHGLGLGARLFTSMKESLKSMGFDKKMLWTLEENSSRGFYEKMGGVLLNLEKNVDIGGVPLKHVAYGF